MARIRKSIRSNFIYALYTLVLWGPQFDEVTAVTLTTRLRAAGLRVKIVSLAGKFTMGKSRLAIGADMFLEKALSLVDQTLCVIMPCSTEIIASLEKDERVLAFFEEMHSNNVTIVISAADRDALTALKLLEPVADKVIICPQGDDLVPFGQQLAMHLHNVGESWGEPDKDSGRFTLV